YVPLSFLFGRRLMASMIWFRLRDRITRREKNPETASLRMVANRVCRRLELFRMRLIRDLAEVAQGYIMGRSRETIGIYMKCISGPHLIALVSGLKSVPVKGLLNVPGQLKAIREAGVLLSDSLAFGFRYSRCARGRQLGHAGRKG